jgi:hypothetical protein
MTAETIVESAACTASVGAKETFELVVTPKDWLTDDRSDTADDIRAERAPWTPRLAESVMLAATVRPAMA